MNSRKFNRILRFAPPSGRLLFLVLTFVLFSGLKGASEGELVVFTQPGVSRIEKNFSERHLPAIQSLAAKLGLDLKVMNVKNGAPEDITVTPLVVFQNYRGRSVFQGRYASVDKLHNFIRIAQSIPLSNQTYSKKHVAIWRHGRAVVVAPIKITELAGSKQDDYSHDEFVKMARLAIMSGFSKFMPEETVEIGRTDRLFYMDFYPHRDEDGGFQVSLSLFSQFNCVQPVFKQFQTPVSGRWSDFESTFAAAGGLLEAEVFRQIETSDIGDGFTVVDLSVPVAGWETLGLTLPQRQEDKNHIVPPDLTLPTRWIVAKTNQNGSPRLHFRFPPPLDSYAGEATKLAGELVLSGPNSLAGATGWIEVKAGSVTLGDETLDQAVYSKMLQAQEHPLARFNLERVEVEDGSLQFGRLTRFNAYGVFELKGVAIPLAVRAQAEPFLDANGPAIRVVAAFSVRLMEKFNILGPDGPEPQNDTLDFYVDLLFRPAE